MTVSAYSAVKPPSAVFTVILALPGASAVTTPLTTLATVGAELAHVTVLLLASAGFTVAVSVVCPPTVSLPEAALSDTPVTATVWMPVKISRS